MMGSEPVKAASDLLPLQADQAVEDDGIVSYGC